SAIAAGADGLMIETHPNPAIALSDGPQSLTFPQFDDLCNELRPIANVMGRTF
ncbi:MAG: 3-deoxy-7-phosphoheptulonate synthase, partial [Clostridium sp.]|nr:3-deoxy-7-phosphoheptulonate synthase [Clostridium sp.]